MRIKIKTIIASLSLIVGLASCDKSDHVPLPPVEKSRLVDQIEYSGNFLKFHYDASDRLTEASNSSFAQKYFYSGNTFRAEFYDQTNYMYGELRDGVLDNEGRLKTTTFVYHQPGQPDGLATDEYFYNNEGYLIKTKRTGLTSGNVYEELYTWDNGNLVTYTSMANGQFNYRQEYTYNTQLPNKLSLDLHLSIVNMYTDKLTGKRNKNLVKTMQNFNHQNIKNLDYVYAYDIDVMGYPTKYSKKNLLNNFEIETLIKYKN